MIAMPQAWALISTTQNSFVGWCHSKNPNAVAWLAVLYFPHKLAFSTSPSETAMVLSAVIVSSLQIRTATIQPGSQPRGTSIIRVAVTINLSARGSRNAPMTDTSPHFLARYPSMMSVIIAPTNIAMVMMQISLLGTSVADAGCHNNQTITGTAAIRPTVMLFGMFQKPVLSLFLINPTRVVLSGNGSEPKGPLPSPHSVGSPQKVVSRCV